MLVRKASRACLLVEKWVCISCKAGGEGPDSGTCTEGQVTKLCADLRMSPWEVKSGGTVISQGLHFCHKGGIMCLSEVIDSSPGNLDSCLRFIQPSVSHDVYSACRLNQQGGDRQP